MVVKGEIPVVEESYDVSDPVSTGKTALTGMVGFAMLFGIVAGGRAIWNRVSQSTNALGEVEVF